MRLTLTGSGGGSWLRRLGAADPAEPPELDPLWPADATLVADVVDFCRLLADRGDADIAVHRTATSTSATRSSIWRPPSPTTAPARCPEP